MAQTQAAALVRTNYKALLRLTAAIPTDEPSGKDVLKSTVRACYRKGTFTDESAGADVFGLLVKVLEDPKQSKEIALLHALAGGAGNRHYRQAVIHELCRRAKGARESGLI
mmetsp:Transcript_56596/g.133272  ORF Transcript_56596/g.133272 Transcript_56596/m.133272 type:complete len:111 (-) Transcript_56596:10-342(-)